MRQIFVRWKSYAVYCGQAETRRRAARLINNEIYALGGRRVFINGVRARDIREENRPCSRCGVEQPAFVWVVP